MLHTNNQLYKVTNSHAELPGVVTLELTPTPESGIILFKPGQYIDIFLSDQNISEGKSYSISSTPGNPYIEITVKEIGLFSQSLTQAPIGSLIHGSEPRGYFYSETHETELVFFAAGIGITPIVSILRNSVAQTPGRNITLYYTNRYRDSILFEGELLHLQNIYPSIKIIFFLTREQPQDDTFLYERIDPKKYITPSLQTTSTEYFICGSIDFVKSMWHALKSSGVPEYTIYTEAFFSH